MADSFVQLPPDSTGKLIDTRTQAGGDHRQVVVVGDATAATVQTVGANGAEVDVKAVPADPFGANADAAVVTDASGSISAKLRGLVALMVTLVSHASRLLSSAFAAAGNAAAATTGFLTGLVYNATPATFADGSQAPLQGDSHGYLKVNVAAGGAGGGAATVADAADVTQGALADAAIDTDTTGTVSGKLRGLVKLLVALIAKTSTLVNGRTQVVVTTSANVPVEPIIEPAHGAADDANGPQKIGGKAVATTPAAVSAADRTDALFDVDGALVSRQTLLGDVVSGVQAITDGSSTSVIASAGSGIKNYITDVDIANTSATVVTVDLRDGAAGAVKATFIAPAGGGVSKSYRTPLAFSAATAVCADPSAAASTITVTLAGFKSRV